jgi:distribution and morphology protein 31
MLASNVRSSVGQLARNAGVSVHRIAGPSSVRYPVRSPDKDRYLAIHNFFTRQAQSPFHTPLVRRFNSTQSSQSCSKCFPTPKATAAPVVTPPGHAQDYTPFIRRLMRRSQSLTTTSPTRPTKEQLLDAAGSWWERLRVRMKWFTIRGWRRFNADDYGAFASVFVLGNSMSVVPRCGIADSWQRCGS